MHMVWNNTLKQKERKQDVIKDIQRSGIRALQAKWNSMISPPKKRN